MFFKKVSPIAGIFFACGIYAQEPPVDSDGDGIPDEVEIAIGTNPNVFDSDRDPDSDGQISFAEYVGGSDPNNIMSTSQLMMAKNDFEDENDVSVFHSLQNVSISHNTGQGLGQTGSVKIDLVDTTQSGFFSLSLSSTARGLSFASKAFVLGSTDRFRMRIRSRSDDSLFYPDAQYDDYYMDSLYFNGEQTLVFEIEPISSASGVSVFFDNIVYQAITDSVPAAFDTESTAATLVSRDSGGNFGEQPWAELLAVDYEGNNIIHASYVGGVRRIYHNNISESVVNEISFDYANGYDHAIISKDGKRALIFDLRWSIPYYVNLESGEITNLASMVHRVARNDQITVGSDSSAISADGRYVTVMVDYNMTNGVKLSSGYHLIRIDMQEETLSTISQGENDVNVDVGGIFANVRMDDSGQNIAFHYAGTALTRSSSGTRNIYIMNMETQELKAVNYTPSGRFILDRDIAVQGVSGDGRYVYFSGEAIDFGYNNSDDSNIPLRFRRDTVTNTTDWIERYSHKGEPIGVYGNVTAGSSGRYGIAWPIRDDVIYSYFRFNDYARYDSVTQTYRPIVTPNGMPVDIREFSLSGSGRYVFFKTYNNNVLPELGLRRNAGSSYGHIYRIDLGGGDDIEAQQTPAHTASDFDKDNIADIAWFNTSDVRSIVQLSDNDGTLETTVAANATDIPVNGDFDGDGIADVAFMSPVTFRWYIRHSSDGSERQVFFGLGDDYPVPADYDGDGITDLAIRDRSSGWWYIQYSSTGGIDAHLLGRNAEDIPVPADYDGDGIDDLAVRRPSNKTWYIRNSSQIDSITNHPDGITRLRFGLRDEDIPVPADYDGDGKVDVAVRRPSTHFWYIRNSSGSDHLTSFNDGISRRQFGRQSTDLPVIADYNGDGKADISVYRPSNGFWYILNSNGDNYNSSRGDGIQRILTDRNVLPVNTDIMNKMSLQGH